MADYAAGQPRDKIEIHPEIDRMEVYFQLVRDAGSLRKACEELERSDVLGFDTETTELDPYRGELRLLQLSSGKNTYVIDLRAFGSNGDLAVTPELAPLRSLLASGDSVKAAHNAKFDAKWVRHHLGTDIGGLYDTYLASQLIAAGDQDRRHGLADVAQFFLGTELDKTEQISDWSAAELAPAQIEYAARDAAIMVPLREKLHERLVLDDLERVAQLEFDCIMPIAAMELNGIFLDEGRWREQLEKVRVAQVKAADELQDMLSAGVAQASLFGRAEINLDSQVQVTDALLNLGVPVPDTPKTGRIHADFRQIGAPTGRFSCSNPNLQQIPQEEAYRRCFRAPDGKKLVVADYSQIELRILAEFSRDENFIKAFVSGQDFHTTTAAQVFNTEPQSVTPEQRSFAKRLNFGVVYGIGASRFALMTGLSQNEAENTLRRYFATYRGLDEWLREAGKKVVLERTARTASGRMMRFRFDENDRQQIASAQRNGKNMPIQGTSADILKRALRLLHEDIAGTSARLVNIVHDEVIVECEASEADSTAAKLEHAMVSAGREYIKEVPVKADVKIADQWCK
jgi:DNA polymerase-1